MNEVASKMRPTLSALEQILERSKIPSKLIFASGNVQSFGSGTPRFTVTLHNDRILHARLNEFTLGKAYVDGEFDIDGDMMSVLDFRDHLKHQSELSMRLKFINFLFLKSATYVNKWAISTHYEFGDDFYLSFIDNRYRFYSHCVFHSDDETLEEAAENKLEAMFSALELRPGMRLLDIGAGWGGVHEYCGPRGVHVTSITLTEDSYNYTSDLIERMGLENCRVKVEDFLRHTPDEPYDAVVIYGVIEHIPYYRTFCRKLWECLKPGGLFYLDASANQVKYDMSDFTRKYIWQGTHTFLNLQEFTQELLYHGMEVINIKNESKDYELTMKHWASQFDTKKDEIVKGWGDQIYRSFRMYLWGGCHAFRVNRLQAYSLVARRHRLPGPRPSMIKRIYSFVRSLV